MRHLRWLAPLSVLIGLVAWMLVTTTRATRQPTVDETTPAPTEAPLPAPTVAPTPVPRPAQPTTPPPAPQVSTGPVDKHGEPLMVDPPFAGFTRSHWREHYTRGLGEKQRDLAESRRIVEQADQGQRVDDKELAIARMRIRDLTRRIEADRQALDALPQAR